MIQGYGLSEEDYRGTRFADWKILLKGCNDLLVLTRPQVIAEIHEAYLKAGADIISTDTFNASAVSMADYGLEAYVYEMNRAAAALARLARRSQRSTHRAALGPMVSDAMSRMRSSSTNPMRIGRFPLFWWLFLSNQYSTLYSREASRRQAPAVSCGAFVVY